MKDFLKKFKFFFWLNIGGTKHITVRPHLPERERRETLKPGPDGSEKLHSKMSKSATSYVDFL